MFFKKIDKKNEDQNFLNFENDFIVDIKAREEQKRILKAENAVKNENDKKNRYFYIFFKKIINCQINFKAKKKKYKFDFLKEDEIKRVNFLELFKRYFLVNKYFFKRISHTSADELSITSLSKLIFQVSFNMGWLFFFFWRFLLILVGVVFYKIFKYFKISIKMPSPNLSLPGKIMTKKIKQEESLNLEYKGEVNSESLKAIKSLKRANLRKKVISFADDKLVKIFCIKQIKLIFWGLHKRIIKSKKIVFSGIFRAYERAEYFIVKKLFRSTSRFCIKIIIFLKRSVSRIFIKNIVFLKKGVAGIVEIFKDVAIFLKFLPIRSYEVALNKISLLKIKINFIFSKIKSILLDVKKSMLKLVCVVKEKSRNMKNNRIEKGRVSFKEHEELKEVYFEKKFIPKAILSFTVLAILLVIPFKGADFYTSLNLKDLKARVVEASERAMSNFYSASESIVKMNTNEAVKNFSKADSNLLEAKKQVGEINGLILQLSKFAPKKELRMASVGEQVLDSGILASKLGEDMSLFLEILLQINGDVLNSSSSIDMIDVFNDIEKQSEVVNKDLKNLKESIFKIDESVLTNKYLEKFKELKSKIEDFEFILNKSSSMIANLKIFFGVEKDKKYLFVFQNSNEMRATGGFIGSIAIADFSKGKLSSLDVPEGGSYDLDGSLNKFIVAPKPLQLVTPRWFFRDANWWPDWSVSAKKLMWFYEHSGGETVDGCISFTPNVLGSFLEVTGPIDMTDEYGVIIDSENFWEIIREDIEENKTSKTPKTIIKDLFDEILNNLSQNLNKERIGQILQIIQGSLDAKDVLFFLKDSELQEIIEEKKWGGKIEETSGDYLSVINTNIAGGKSDKYIEQEIVHNAEIMSDGSVVDTVIIYRSHMATSTDSDYYTTRNVDWLRVYVPMGSELIDASGFDMPNEIYFEEPEEHWGDDPYLKQQEDSSVVYGEENLEKYIDSGKTVFAGWSMVDTGERDVIQIKYKLPFKFILKDEIENNFINTIKDAINKDKKDFFSYSLLVQKQAGANNVKIKKILKVNDFYNINWSYPENLKNENIIRMDGDLKKDQFWAILFSN